ncbi:MAG: hypothetical protein JWP18_1579, partial [Solirubrobacterales bacterium]|nr:hypothetical protein [Solirubrobacterales bacterium]
VRRPTRASTALGADFGRRSTEVLLAFVTMAVLLAALTVVPNRLGVGVIVPTVGILVVLAAFLNPRIDISLYGIAIYLGCADGPVKLISGTDKATLFRDVLLFAVVGGVLARGILEDRRLPRIPYRWPLVAFVTVVAVQALNPGTPSLTGVVAGWRQQLAFAPLLLLGVMVADRRGTLRTIGIVLLALTVPNMIAAVIQNTLTPEQFGSWGPGYADRVLGRGAFANTPRTFYEGGGDVDRVRPFGLGADSGGAGILGWLGLPFALAFALSKGWQPKLWLGAGGVLVCATAILTSQSRGVILTSLVAVLAFFALRAKSRNAISTTFALGGAAMLIFVFVTVFTANSSTAAVARLQTLAPGQAAATISSNRGSSLTIVGDYAVSYPLGVGLGRAGPGSGAVGRPSGLNAENEFNFLIGEIGLIGLLAFAWLWGAVVLDAVRLARREPDETRRTLWCALAATLIATTAVWFQASPTNSSASAPVFWLFAGVVGQQAFALRAAQRAAAALHAPSQERRTFTG